MRNLKFMKVSKLKNRKIMKMRIVKVKKRAQKWILMKKRNSKILVCSLLKKSEKREVGSQRVFILNSNNKKN